MMMMMIVIVVAYVAVLDMIVIDIRDTVVIRIGHSI